MKLSLGLRCSTELKTTLRMTMMKRCPHCKWDNDLSTAFDQWPELGSHVVPLCAVCGGQLWKYPGGFMRFVKIKGLHLTDRSLDWWICGESEKQLTKLKKRRP